MTQTYLFYDIETTGLNKAFDQIVQFACIRTDSNLNELEREEFFVRLNKDVIPSPKAFITHRIPLEKLNQGLTEFEAIKKIHHLVNTPNTISIGYNSLGFDDEFLRFSFYRNLLPPYTHQYANNCSRMDLYPMTVMYYLFKNDCLNWPENNLKLENISKANNYAEGMAHNAMVDVIATLKLARCLFRDKKTWDYVSGYFNKQIDLERTTQPTYLDNDFPVAIMIDGKFGYDQQYQAPVIPLGNHHHYKNQQIWLRIDSPNILETTPQNFIEKNYVINKKMGESGWILPMKERYLKNSLMNKQKEIHETISFLQKNKTLLESMSQYYLNYTYPKIPNLDISAALYEVGFPNFKDQELCQQFHLGKTRKNLDSLNFSAPHLKELAFRIFGRHFPEYLNSEEKFLFEKYIASIKSAENISCDHRGKTRPTLATALQEIDELNQTPQDKEQQQILIDLKNYLENLNQS